MASKLGNLILHARDIESETVVVPEWGGVRLEVRGLDVASRDELLGEGMRQRDFAVLLLVATLHDPETGERVFEPAEVEKLRHKSIGVVKRLTDVALKVSGMLPESKDDLGKGSGSTPSDASASS